MVAAAGGDHGDSVALLGALLAVLIRHMPNDIYFQIGLLVLIGLAAKTRS